MGSLRSTLRFNILGVAQTSKSQEITFWFSLLVQGYKTSGLYTNVLEGHEARPWQRGLWYQVESAY